MYDKGACGRGVPQWPVSHLHNQSGRTSANYRRRVPCPPVQSISVETPLIFSRGGVAASLLQKADKGGTRTFFVTHRLAPEKVRVPPLSHSL